MARITSMIVVGALSLAAFLPPADAASCSHLGRSLNSDRPVTVTFLNRSGEYRSVMWVDFKGKLVPYANLNPGERYTVNTFVTHPWVFTDGPGNCIEMFMPRNGVAQFSIAKKSTGVGGD